MHSKTVGLMVTLVLAAACAGPQAASEPAPDKGEYTTGSNIPRKPGRTAAGDRVEKLDPADVRKTPPGGAVPAAR